jgi:hypothetical protein
VNQDIKNRVAEIKEEVTSKSFYPTTYSPDEHNFLLVEKSEYDYLYNMFKEVFDQLEQALARETHLFSDLKIFQEKFTKIRQDLINDDFEEMHTGFVISQFISFVNIAFQSSAQGKLNNENKQGE